MKKNSLTSVLALALLASFLTVPTVAASFGSPIGHSFIISNQSTEELDPAVAYNSQQREYLAVFWNDRPATTTSARSGCRGMGSCWGESGWRLEWAPTANTRTWLITARGTNTWWSGSNTLPGGPSRVSTANGSLCPPARATPNCKEALYLSPLVARLPVALSRRWPIPLRRTSTWWSLRTAGGHPTGSRGASS